MQHRAGALALVLPVAEQERLVSRRGVVEVELALRAVLEARERRVRAEERRQEDVGEPAFVPALRVRIERAAGHRAAQETDQLAGHPGADRLAVVAGRLTRTRADAREGREPP